MTIKYGLVSFDSTDPIALGEWWCQQLDAVVLFSVPGEGMMIHSKAADIVLGFQRVPDPTPGKNRVHIDFQAVDRQAEVDLLVAAGATVVDTQQSIPVDGMPSMTWNILADPEGNQFCVADMVAMD